MKSHLSKKGFTLIELMIVVSIIGVLAALALAAYGQTVRKSREADTRALFVDYATKQEEYRALTGAYLPGQSAFCPQSVGTSAEAFEPSSCSNGAIFLELGISTPRATYFQYSFAAGGPGLPPCAGQVPSGVSTNEMCNSIEDDTPWWAVVARGDQDGDGNHSVILTTSGMGGRVYTRESGE